MGGGAIEFANRGRARAVVVTCITLLIIDDDEVCGARVCWARMDNLEMVGCGGKRKLLGY